MKTSKDVVDHGEVRKCKSSRESSLYSRQVNYINHTLTHRCQSYCLIEYKHPQLFDPTIYSATDPNRFVSNGIEMISICEKKCRMKFGIALKFDPSGENNLTEGMPHQMAGTIKFDGNQQPKYFARRNHPRLVQRATASMYWGANTDIQRLLMSSLGEYLIKHMGKDVFPKFLFYLDVLKVRGLEQYSGLITTNDYITGYTYKGGKNSVVWGDTMEDMLDAYIKSGKEGNLRSLVATIMNDVLKNRVCPDLKLVLLYVVVI